MGEYYAVFDKHGRAKPSTFSPTPFGSIFRCVSMDPPPKDGRKKDVTGKIEDKWEKRRKEEELTVKRAKIVPEEEYDGQH